MRVTSLHEAGVEYSYLFWQQRAPLVTQVRQLEMCSLDFQPTLPTPSLCPCPTMTDHPTLSWEAMQDGSVFYTRHQLYSIPGKLPGDLNDFIIAGCRYGGPIGVSTMPNAHRDRDVEQA